LRQINRSCKKNRQAFATAAPNHTPSLVGAGSTRESRTAVHQIHRAKPFAGRARSHKDRWQSLWERVLPAKATPRFCRYNAPNPSRAEPAPTRIDGSPCGSGFYPRKPRCGPPDTPRQTLRGQSPLPQGSMAVPCGSGFYLRRSHRGSAGTTSRILRGQSPLPQGYLLPREATAPVREQLAWVISGTALPRWSR